MPERRGLLQAEQLLFQPGKPGQVRCMGVQHGIDVWNPGEISGQFREGFGRVTKSARCGQAEGQKASSPCTTVPSAKSCPTL